MSSGISNGRVPHSTHKPNAHYSTIRHLIKSKVDSFSPETRRTLLILFRAFALGWSVSALPALLGLYIKILIKAVKTNSFPSLQKLAIDTLRKLYKGIARNGVPWLFCGSLGGHRLVEPLLKKLMKDAPSNSAKESIKDQKRLLASSFIASALTIFSVHRLFPRTGTLDITLFAAVRAGDVFAHRLGSNEYAKKKLPSWLLHNGDVIVFVLACTEIMFSWFFAPNRLPKSYNNWISRMANMDQRLLEALRMIRTGEFVYGKDTGVSALLMDYCSDIGLPRSYGDPITGRIHCNLVHDGHPGGCEGNAARRFSRGFAQAFLIYLPVHLLPPLIFKRKKLLDNPLDSSIHIVKAAMRSSGFLASFIALTWYGVCLTRTRIGHQILRVDQSRLDNTLAPLIGCMMCGFSILLENKHRRGEMALYVAPRAIYSLMERVLGPHRRGRSWEKWAAEASEIAVFSGAVATVIEAMYRRDDMVRSSVKGIMKWVQDL